METRLNTQTRSVPSQSFLTVLLLLICSHIPTTQSELVFLGQQPFQAFVSRGAQSGENIYQFFVVDTQLQGPQGDVTFSTPQVSSLPFVLVPTTGQLLTTDIFTQTEYNFTVLATLETVSIATEITVYIVPLSDMTPRFEHAEYNIEIFENLPTKTAFSVIRAFSLRPGTANRQYSIVVGNSNSDLSINGNSGVLRVENSPDRERTDSYFLTVRYLDTTTSIDVIVSVAILDTNDNSPNFSQSLYNITIPESVSVGTSIATVLASDKDIELNNVTSYHLDLAFNKTFEVDPDTGVLRTLTQLDYERQSRYQFIVTAMDMGTPSQSSVVTVLVNLINIDDECPMFENPVFVAELTYNIDGTLPDVGTPIVTVMATDPDRFSEVVYAVVLSDDSDSVLLLDSTSGVITLARTDIDPRGQFTLNVSASDQNCTGQSFVRVEIGIGNVNDHSPEFQTECVATLRENPPVGTEVISLLATDEDIGLNGLVTYSLLTNSDLFTIDTFSGTVRTDSAPEMFDRETRSSFQVGVTASDGGNRQDYCLLTVTLTDENDNPPQISLAQYNRSLARNSTIGTFVFQVTAVDPDVGNNGRITYSINSTAPFQVGSENGAITTSGQLSAMVEEYMFTLLATDQGEEVRLTSSVTVSIMLTENINFPVFEEFNYTGRVCENAQFRTHVLTVSASSPAMNGVIVYEIIEGTDYRSNSAEVFSIHRVTNGAEIRVGSNSLVDFERLAPNLSFQFFVEAQNSAGSSLVLVEIFVDDVDDNSPKFLSDSSFFLAENEPTGTTVAQVEAMDSDSGTNGQLRYRLDPSSPSPYFNITEDGLIVSTHVFDYESDSQPLQGNLFVEAYNPNPLPTTSTCFSQASRDTVTTIIHWMVRDENDNPPVFPNRSVSVQVPETKAIQSRIYQLNVHDPDPSNNDNLRYSIIAGNDGSFGVDSNYIILTRRLDYETRSLYNLLVQVTDGVHSGGNCPLCVAMVYISVTDVDDEAPIFSSQTYHADILENAPIGTCLLTLSASDTDSLSISYELRGLAEGRFTVDQSGVIRVSGEVDREEFPGGELVFLAFAEGGSLATADVVINILDVNDYSPRFTGLFRGRVEENSLPGEAGLYVGRVRAVDLDQGENGSINYFLVTGEEDGFVIDRETGIITAHAQYDREAVPSYEITVEARDNGFPVQLSSESPFFVEIGDVNDNGPFFPYRFMFSRVFEGSPTGHTLLVVPAADPDNGTNATVSYILESFSPPEVKFELDPATGEVTVAGSLDYEIPQHRLYLLTISIRNGGFVSSSSGVLQIDLLDLNDNTPVIESIEQTNLNLQETFPPGAVVAMVTASDQDSGENGELEYKISSGNENEDFVLSVEGNVASISTSNPFDYETTPSYSLVITVSDRGTPPRDISEEIIFNIIDVNDEHPTFSNSVYSIFIPENATPSGGILQVEAFDRDTGSGGEVVRYAIISGNDDLMFAMTANGTLYSCAVFDREMRSSYTLTVIAFDGGVIPLNSTAKIKVTITDVNDNPSMDGGYLTVLIYSLNGHVLPGDIGPLYFIDPDIDDQFTACTIQSQTFPGMLFVIDEESCTLRLQEPHPPEGTYTFQRVLGRDGVHTTVITRATIIVEHLPSSEVAPDNLLTLTLNASSEMFFQERLNETFPVEMARVLEVAEDQVHIVTVQVGHYIPDNSVDITLTVTDRNGVYLEPTAIIQSVFLNRASLVVGGHAVLDLPVDMCVSEPCKNQARCKTVQTVLATEKVSSTRQFVLFAPRIEFSYECDCVLGTAGELCDVNFDDCYSNPCQFGGQCTDQVNGFSCDCSDGRGGVTCDLVSNLCNTDTCLNGGTCEDRLDSYVCACLPGTYGSKCEYHYFRPSSFCAADNPCQNGAECSSGRDGFTCVCLAGFMGTLCETETQLQGGCVGNPCYNGSTCLDSPQGHDCICSVGFTGPGCQWPLNNCELSLCENGASCEQGLYGTYSCLCLPGFTGENCDLFVSGCISKPCLNQARCVDHTDGTYTCQCVPGYYGDTCEFSVAPPDLCETNSCSVDSNCTSGRDLFTCECVERFIGRDCSVATSTDSPVQPCSRNPCLHGGECLENTSTPAGYRCSCTVGFTGNNCEDDIDECSSGPCANGGVCVDGINGYVCTCPSRLTGNECQIFCPEGYSGTFCTTPVSFCTPNPCANGTTCIEHEGGFSCVCPPDLTGTVCDMPNSCASRSCGNGGTCVDEEDGSSYCSCGQAFTGDQCELVTVSFSGSQRESSYRTFGSLDIHGQGLIEFEFATVDENGLLLYNTQYQSGQSNDYIAVEVVGGALEVSISLGSGESTASSRSVFVSDGLWHRVSIATGGQVCSKCTPCHIMLFGFQYCFVMLYFLNLDFSCSHRRLFITG